MSRKIGGNSIASQGISQSSVNSNQPVSGSSPTTNTAAAGSASQTQAKETAEQTQQHPLPDEAKKAAKQSRQLSGVLKQVVISQSLPAAGPAPNAAPAAAAAAAAAAGPGSGTAAGPAASGRAQRLNADLNAVIDWKPWHGDAPAPSGDPRITKHHATTNVIPADQVCERYPLRHKPTLDPLSEQTFLNGAAGNGFIGIMNINDGKIYLNPLVPDRQGYTDYPADKRIQVSTVGANGTGTGVPAAQTRSILTDDPAHGGSSAHEQLRNLVTNNDPDAVHFVGFMVRKGPNGGIDTAHYRSTSLNGSKFVYSSGEGRRLNSRSGGGAMSEHYASQIMGTLLDRFGDERPEPTPAFVSKNAPPPPPLPPKPQ